MILKNIFFILPLLLLSSCAANNFTTAEILAPDEGLVLTDCSTRNTLDRYVNFLETNYKYGNPKVYVKCSQGGNLVLVKMKAGSYYVSGDDKEFNKERQATAPRFIVQPNKVNYIGDLNFTVGYSYAVLGPITNTETYFYVSKNYNFEGTKKKFMNAMPDIARKYEVVFSAVK